MTWEKRVNLSILSICFVDTWKAYSNATHKKSMQREFYLRLSEELVDNTYGQLFARSIRPLMGLQDDDFNSNGGLLGCDGSVCSGLRIHLTPTKKAKSTWKGNHTIETRIL